MATTFRCLISVLFLILVIKGSCGCSLNNINIGTSRSGRVIQGRPEWDVVVTNNCACAQSRITFACKGFQSVEGVPSSILRVEGDSCLLIDGNTLQGFGTVRFSYAWDPPFLLMPTSSLLDPCS